MVSLNCPLCCNETFQSATLLKRHLLNILDNLLCPLCDKKFDKLAELADHLESDCRDPLKLEKNPENEGYKNSLLAKALLAGPPRNVPLVMEKVEVEESQYYCQMCGVNFDDIEGHLREFHEGEEVILEETNHNEDNENEGDSESFITVETIAQTEPETQEHESNTFPEQEFKDKDGRLYTRKFVKIDKFWLQDGSNTAVQSKIIATATGTMKCANCDLFFGDSEMVKSHKCEELKCSQCPLVFQDADLFYEHTKVHSVTENATKKAPAGPFSCEVCNTVFPTFKSLRLHRRMHEPIKTREIDPPSKFGLHQGDVSDEQVRQMFVCKICNKSYDKRYESVHAAMHASPDAFNCDICNRKFLSQSTLDMHMKAHTNNKKFTCSYCKKPFVTYDALNDHLANQCQKRAYACQFCGRRFARPHEKVKHERIHTGEKPHVCDICGKAFRVSYCLTLHLRTHSGKRPYQCKDCGKRFKSHSVYNHHLLTHSDVRKYKCPYCPKAFKTSVQLAGHKNSHIKPFTCTECNRPFASLYAVRAHMDTHKRDNNLKYECWMCGALYSRAFALRDHLKQQHQQVEGEKKAVALSVEEEMEATNSILVNGDDIILGLDGTNIEIIENVAD